MHISRRQFVRTLTAGTVVAMHRSRVLSAQTRYDIILKGGRVIDPSLRLDGIRDVAIANGRIAAVEAGLVGDAADVVDVRGKLVVPGLIDIHTHAGRVKGGPALCLADGVTGFIDAGSQGADGIADPVAIAKSASQPARVWFDVGNGRTGHLRWDIVEQVMQAGFWPDTLSTDWTPEGRTAQVFNFPNVMSKFLDFGMSLEQVIARATLNPSRVFEVFRDRGTLNVGAPADVAVLELRQGTFEFVDNFTNTRSGRQKLFPIATVLGGKRVASA